MCLRGLVREEDLIGCEGVSKEHLLFGTLLVMAVIVVLWLFSDRAISPYIIIGSASMNGGYGGRLGLLFLCQLK